MKLLVDPLASNTSRTAVDYKEDLQGSRFVIDNPTLAQHADAVLHSRSRRGNNDGLLKRQLEAGADALGRR